MFPAQLGQAAIPLKSGRHRQRGIIQLCIRVVCLVHIGIGLPALPREDTSCTTHAGKPLRGAKFRHRAIALVPNETNKGITQGTRAFDTSTGAPIYAGAIDNRESRSPGSAGRGAIASQFRRFLRRWGQQNRPCAGRVVCGRADRRQRLVSGRYSALDALRMGSLQPAPK